MTETCLLRLITMKYGMNEDNPMKKNMKAQMLKKIVVKCADFWMDELEVDSDIFDDIYLEAATRAIEKRKDLPGFKVTIVIETWEKKDFKKPERHFCYNTYRVLVNAGLHDKAEMLRLNFMRMHGVDLQKENLRGNNDGIAPNKSELDAPRSGSEG